MAADEDGRKALAAFLTNDPFAGLPGDVPFLGGIAGGGEPSRYSRSPDLWNDFFRRVRIPGRFGAFDLPREDLFPGFARAALGLPGFLDLTVTNPYKAAAFRCLDALPVRVEAADRVSHLGCLNHIVLDPRTGTGWADNTDGQGMTRALRKRTALDGARVLLVGAGGAAASIGYELLREGAELFIANIVEEDAHALAADLGRFRRPGRTVSAGGWNMIGRLAPGRDIIVSAVTVSTPLPPEGIETLPPKILLTDVRYGAAAEFAAAARRVGRPCIDGREMLYGQFRLAAERVGAVLGLDPGGLSAALEDIENRFLAG